jgi:iron complex outermembrane receptor protein
MAISSKKLQMLAGVAAVLAASPGFAQAMDATVAPTTGSAGAAVPGESGPYASNDSSDIVVTGTIQAYRGNVPLRELPQATQVLSVATLQQLNISRLDTALDLSASVSRQNGFGGLFDAFAIRGFVGDPNTPSGFLINGFSGARGYGGTRDTSGVEAIEILRGPTSALFGRGEPGGTVNIVTKKPALNRAFGYVSGSVGRFDTYRGEADYNMPINDILAARVTGAYEQGDSYRDTVNYSKYAITPSFLLQTGGFTANLEFEYGRQKIPFDRGVIALNGDPRALPRSRFLGEPEDGPNRTKNLGPQLQIQQKLGGDWKILGGVAYRYTLLKGFGEEPEFGAGRNPLFTGTLINGAYTSRRRVFRRSEGKDFIPRAEVSGSIDLGGIKNNLLVGADYEWFKLDIYQDRFRPGNLTAAQRAQFASGNPSRATLLATNSISLYSPVYFTPSELATLPMTPFQSRTEVAKAWGTYIRDRIEFTDWLSVQGGVRYDDYRQTVDNRLNGVQTKQDFTKWSPSAGVSVKPSEHLTVYGSYSEGFRANTGVNVRNEAFKPETTVSYEVGTKFDLIDKMLTGTIAVFKMKKSNLLTADPVNAGFTLDVGKAKSKGVEFDLNAKLPEGLNLVFSYAYVDAVIADDILDPDFGRTIRAGDPLINIPKNSITLLASKDFRIGDREMTLGGDIKYVDKRLGETAVQYFLPDYTLVRLFGSLDVTENITVSGEVSNLFNVYYLPSSYAQLWTFPGAPRTWSAKVKVRF